MEIDGRRDWGIGDVKLSWRPQDHPGGSVAYRIDWPNGKRLVYATDTSGDTSDEHTEWSRDADLLMHECYFRDESKNWAVKTGHCWSSRVAEVSNCSNPRKLLLTHINPLDTTDDPVSIESIRASVAAEVLLAEDGKVIEF
jgi:ribonuclease BN (tRNA processing enzyme)